MKFLPIAGALLALSFSIAFARADDLQAKIMALGGKDCRDSNLTCVDIEVPVDHAHPDPGRHLTLHLAVHFAEEESKGIMFYAVGGPGGAGTALAQSYLDSFDERLSKELDVVFFDQRGVGAKSGVDCPKAAVAFDSEPITLQQPEQAVAAAKAFVDSCVREMSPKELLPYLGTSQAIQDLEEFRQAIGAPKVWFYGESYGTQFAQEYAARYPDALDGVILDGVVDLTRTAESYYTEDTRTAERILGRLLDACDAEAHCRADMGASAASVYDGLAARLHQAPVTVDYPLGSGGFAQRPMNAAILEDEAFYALYGPESRAEFLRALAASTRGNLVPLLGLGYQDIGVDPNTLAPAPDPTFYGGAYYAITCPDYDDAGHDPAAQAKAILDQANAFAPKAPRFQRNLYAERLVCAFWPVKGAGDPPPAFKGGDYPTIVLNSDTDPATPISNGYAVFDRIPNAYMVTMEGGPHVIWGRGNDCPDKIVFGLMLDGRKPEKREQVCRQDFLGAYAPLAAAADAQTPLSLGEAVETEIAQSPQLADWDGYDTIEIGCDYGGALTANAAESGTEYAFKDCGWIPGVKISGDGIDIDAGDGSKPDGLTLRLEVSGAHQGRVTYRHDKTTDAMSVAGSYDGKDVAPPRPMP
ncbi:MAG TPA: alpha/beta hydrolase [Dongiaceae bacterium]|jgi:pimeloyl-ACP methyl ester carboxylesterase|nr:alpha/beta hydrolase [Dongiaceae bacterium]